MKELRYAARCRWLRLTFDERSRGELANLCTHVVREGMRCAGPFVEEMETTCGLWERKPTPSDA